MTRPALTVVVPTFERQRFIDRQVMQWANEEINLVILDGSAKPWKPALQFSDLQHVVYRHMPGAPIEARLRHSEQLVTTPYVALLSDDEFFLPTAVKQCVQFLNEQPLYASCKGFAAAFHVTQGSLQVRGVYPELRDYAVEASSAEQRMTDHMTNYAMASLWSVQRLDVYRACVLGLGQPAFGSAAASEISISVTNAYLGKIAVIDTLMWLRSAENPNIWWKAGNKSFHKWFQDANNLERNRFINLIRGAIHDIPAEAPSFESVESALETYCFSQELTRRQSAARRLMGVKSSAVTHALSWLPQNVAYWIRSKFRPNTIWQVPSAFLRECGGDVINFQIRDVLAVQDLIKRWEALYD